MAYLQEATVRARAKRVSQRLQKSVETILGEAVAALETFDVFLSHSSAEPEEILLGIKDQLEEWGLSVYVDKYSDPQLSPDRVDKKTAEVLRMRLRQSNSLLYVYSRHSQKSRWMPWELGFFDGFKGAVGVIPVLNGEGCGFEGEEYLSLYPYVDEATMNGTDKKYLWINESKTKYARLDKWVKGRETILERS